MADSDGIIAGTALHYGDVIIIVAYFVTILSVGLWSSLKNRGSVGGYFLAGRSMNWLMVGTSLYASNIGSLHFIGLAGSGAASGIAIAMYEINSILILILLGWVFLPVYLASGIFTMPEYLKRRFGGQRIRIYLSVLSLLLYIFTKVAADLYAGTIFIREALNWDIYMSVISLLIISAIFTITGGLTAVIWTELLQTFVMLSGAGVLTVLAFIRVGGYNEMVRKYALAVPNSTLGNNGTCGKPREDYMHLFRDPVKGDIPWPGIFGLFVNSTWYWCADQVIVQRALAGKNYTNAKGGCVLAGYLKILALFIIVFPGMIARILFPDIVGCADPDECMKICGSRYGCSNVAYPLLVVHLMPPGSRGVILAVMLSALMSSLTSTFNSSSTIFTLDIWCRFRRTASVTEQMIVGRLCVVIVVVISILWIPVIQASQGSELFMYIQEISSYLMPPLCAVFVLAILWKRVTEKGAFSAMIIGFIIGAIRFIVEYSYGLPLCGTADKRPAIIKDVHFLYFAFGLFLVSGMVCIAVSLLTEPLPAKYLHRLTYWTRNDQPQETDGLELDSDSEAREENKPINNKSAAQPEEIPRWKKAINWICGIDVKVAENPSHRETGLSLDEDPFWKRFCDVHAVLLTIITVTLCAVYG